MSVKKEAKKIVQKADSLLERDSNGKIKVFRLHRDDMLSNGYDLGFNPRPIYQENINEIKSHKKTFIDKNLYVVRLNEKYGKKSDGKFSIAGGQHLFMAFEDIKYWDCYVFKSPEDDEEKHAILMWGIEDNASSNSHKYITQIEMAHRMFSHFTGSTMLKRMDIINAVARQLGYGHNREVNKLLAYYDILVNDGLFETAIIEQWSQKTIRDRTKINMKEAAEIVAVNEAEKNKAMANSKKEDCLIDVIIKSTGIEMMVRESQLQLKESSGRQVRLTEYQEKHNKAKQEKKMLPVTDISAFL